MTTESSLDLVTQCKLKYDEMSRFLLPTISIVKAPIISLQSPLSVVVPGKSDKNTFSEAPSSAKRLQVGKTVVFIITSALKIVADKYKQKPRQPSRH